MLISLSFDDIFCKVKRQVQNKMSLLHSNGIYTAAVKWNKPVLFSLSLSTVSKYSKFIPCNLNKTSELINSPVNTELASDSFCFQLQIINISFKYFQEMKTFISVTWHQEICCFRGSPLVTIIMLLIYASSSTPMTLVCIVENEYKNTSNGWFYPLKHLSSR